MNASQARFAEWARTSALPLFDEIARSVPSLALRASDGTLVRGRDGVQPEASAIRIAIETRGNVLGTLASEETVHASLVEVLASELTRRFTTETDLEDVLETLAQCYEELNLLYRLASSVQTEDDFASDCRILLGETVDTLDERSVVLMLRDGGHDFVETAASGGREVSDAVRAVGRNRELLDQVRSAPAPEEKGSRSVRIAGASPFGRTILPYLAVPVYDRDGIGGAVVAVHGLDEPPIESGEMKLLECLAAKLSSTLIHRQLQNELKDMLFNTVRCLVAAIEAKDAYTRGHSERVYELSIELGRRLGLSPADLQTLTWSSLLHDIGKIAIPGEILAKPGRLTDEEFEIIKTHPERGCVVLEPIPQLRAVLPGIRHHHERVDGRGYPDGLAGAEIPLLARIIAVADTYDAMVSTRAYRKPRSFEFAVDEVRRSAGTQLDPTIVDAFLELIDAGRVGPGVEPVARDAA